MSGLLRVRTRHFDSAVRMYGSTQKASKQTEFAYMTLPTTFEPPVHKSEPLRVQAEGLDIMNADTTPGLYIGELRAYRSMADATIVFAVWKIVDLGTKDTLLTFWRRTTDNRVVQELTSIPTYERDRLLVIAHDVRFPDEKDVFFADILLGITDHTDTLDGQAGLTTHAEGLEFAMQTPDRLEGDLPKEWAFATPVDYDGRIWEVFDIGHRDDLLTMERWGRNFDVCDDLRGYPDNRVIAVLYEDGNGEYTTVPLATIRSQLDLPPTEASLRTHAELLSDMQTDLYVGQTRWVGVQSSHPKKCIILDIGFPEELLDGGRVPEGSAGEDVRDILFRSHEEAPRRSMVLLRNIATQEVIVLTIPGVLNFSSPTAEERPKSAESALETHAEALEGMQTAVEPGQYRRYIDPELTLVVHIREIGRMRDLRKKYNIPSHIINPEELVCIFTDAEQDSWDNPPAFAVPVSEMESITHIIDPPSMQTTAEALDAFDSLGYMRMSNTGYAFVYRVVDKETLRDIYAQYGKDRPTFRVIDTQHFMWSKDVQEHPEMLVEYADHEGYLLDYAYTIAGEEGITIEKPYPAQFYIFVPQEAVPKFMEPYEPDVDDLDLFERLTTKAGLTVQAEALDAFDEQLGGFRVGDIVRFANDDNGRVYDVEYRVVDILNPEDGLSGALRKRQWVKDAQPGMVTGVEERLSWGSRCMIVYCTHSTENFRAPHTYAYFLEDQMRTVRKVSSRTVHAEGLSTFEQVSPTGARVGDSLEMVKNGLRYPIVAYLEGADVPNSEWASQVDPVALAGPQNRPLTVYFVCQNTDGSAVFPYFLLEDSMVRTLVDSQLVTIVPKDAPVRRTTAEALSMGYAIVPPGTILEYYGSRYTVLASGSGKDMGAVWGQRFVDDGYSGARKLMEEVESVIVIRDEDKDVSWIDGEDIQRYTVVPKKPKRVRRTRTAEALDALPESIEGTVRSWIEDEQATVIYPFVVERVGTPDEIREWCASQGASETSFGMDSLHMLIARTNHTPMCAIRYLAHNQQAPPIPYKLESVLRDSRVDDHRAPYRAPLTRTAEALNSYYSEPVVGQHLVDDRVHDGKGQSVEFIVRKVGTAAELATHFGAFLSSRERRILIDYAHEDPRQVYVGLVHARSPHHYFFALPEYVQTMTTVDTSKVLNKTAEGLDIMLPEFFHEGDVIRYDRNSHSMYKILAILPSADVREYLHNHPGINVFDVNSIERMHETVVLMEDVSTEFRHCERLPFVQQRYVLVRGRLSSSLRTQAEGLSYVDKRRYTPPLQVGERVVVIEGSGLASGKHGVVRPGRESKDAGKLRYISMGWVYVRFDDGDGDFLPRTRLVRETPTEAEQRYGAWRTVGEGLEAFTDDLVGQHRIWKDAQYIQDRESLMFTVVFEGTPKECLEYYVSRGNPSTSWNAEHLHKRIAKGDRTPLYAIEYPTVGVPHASIAFYRREDILERSYEIHLDLQTSAELLSDMQDEQVPSWSPYQLGAQLKFPSVTYTVVDYGHLNKMYEKYPTGKLMTALSDPDAPHEQLYVYTDGTFIGFDPLGALNMKLVRFNGEFIPAPHGERTAGLSVEAEALNTPLWAVGDVVQWDAYTDMFYIVRGLGLFKDLREEFPDAQTLVGETAYEEGVVLESISPTNPALKGTLSKVSLASLVKHGQYAGRADQLISWWTRMHTQAELLNDMGRDMPPAGSPFQVGTVTRLTATGQRFHIVDYGTYEDMQRAYPRNSLTYTVPEATDSRLQGLAPHAMVFVSVSEEQSAQEAPVFYIDTLETLQSEVDEGYTEILSIGSSVGPKEAELLDELTPPASSRWQLGTRLHYSYGQTYTIVDYGLLSFMLAKYMGGSTNPEVPKSVVGDSPVYVLQPEYTPEHYYFDTEETLERSIRGGDGRGQWLPPKQMKTAEGLDVFQTGEFNPNTPVTRETLAELAYALHAVGFQSVDPSMDADESLLDAGVLVNPDGRTLFMTVWKYAQRKYHLHEVGATLSTFQQMGRVIEDNLRPDEEEFGTLIEQFFGMPLSEVVRTLVDATQTEVCMQLVAKWLRFVHTHYRDGDPWYEQAGSVDEVVRTLWPEIGHDLPSFQLPLQKQAEALDAFPDLVRHKDCLYVYQVVDRGTLREMWEKYGHLRSSMTAKLSELGGFDTSAQSVTDQPGKMLADFGYAEGVLVEHVFDVNIDEEGQLVPISHSAKQGFYLFVDTLCYEHQYTEYLPPLQTTAEGLAMYNDVAQFIGQTYKYKGTRYTIVGAGSAERVAEEWGHVFVHQGATQAVQHMLDQQGENLMVFQSPDGHYGWLTERQVRRQYFADPRRKTAEGLDMLNMPLVGQTYLYNDRQYEVLAVGTGNDILAEWEAFLRSEGDRHTIGGLQSLKDMDLVLLRVISGNTMWQYRWMALASFDSRFVPLTAIPKTSEGLSYVEHEHERLPYDYSMSWDDAENFARALYATGFTALADGETDDPVVSLFQKGALMNPTTRELIVCQPFVGRDDPDSADPTFVQCSYTTMPVQDMVNEVEGVDSSVFEAAIGSTTHDVIQELHRSAQPPQNPLPFILEVLDAIDDFSRYDYQMHLGELLAELWPRVKHLMELRPPQRNTRTRRAELVDDPVWKYQVGEKYYAKALDAFIHILAVGAWDDLRRQYPTAFVSPKIQEIHENERERLFIVAQCENQVFFTTIPSLEKGLGMLNSTAAKRRPFLSAAIRLPDGRIFTGAWHADAYRAFMQEEHLDFPEAYPEMPDAILNHPQYSEGFITNQGQYVTREEAAQIMNLPPEMAEVGTFEGLGLMEPEFEETPEGYRRTVRTSMGYNAFHVHLAATGLFKSPAFRVGDEVFLGYTHYYAIEEYVRRVNPEFNDLTPDQQEFEVESFRHLGTEGFTLNNGRFVDREEAGKILRRPYAESLEMWDSGDFGRPITEAGLHAEGEGLEIMQDDQMETDPLNVLGEIYLYEGEDKYLVLSYGRMTDELEKYGSLKVAFPEENHRNRLDTMVYVVTPVDVPFDTVPYQWMTPAMLQEQIQEGHVVFNHLLPRV